MVDSDFGLQRGVGVNWQILNNLFPTASVALEMLTISVSKRGFPGEVGKHIAIFVDFNKEKVVDIV